MRKWRPVKTFAQNTESEQRRESEAQKANQVQSIELAISITADGTSQESIENATESYDKACVDVAQIERGPIEAPQRQSPAADGGTRN